MSKNLETWIKSTETKIAVMQETVDRTKAGEHPTAFVEFSSDQTQKYGPVIAEPVWAWHTTNYRRKPKFRPWTTEEVLVLIAEDRQVANKATGIHYYLNCVKLLSNNKQIGIVRHGNIDNTPAFYSFYDLLHHWVLLSKEPISHTYQPCGVPE